MNFMSSERSEAQREPGMLNYEVAKNGIGIVPLSNAKFGDTEMKKTCLTMKELIRRGRQVSEKRQTKTK